MAYMECLGLICSNSVQNTTLPWTVRCVENPSAVIRVEEVPDRCPQIVAKDHIYRLPLE